MASKDLEEGPLSDISQEDKTGTVPIWIIVIVGHRFFFGFEIRVGQFIPGLY